MAEITPSVPLFEYEPLDRHQPSFRLLEILPRSEDGFIQCSLSHALVPEAPCESDQSPDSYVTLSYTWGPPEPSSWILVNGKRFSVRLNLADFLEAAVAHHPEARHRLWVDAICIDQSNILERNHQVQQMGEIYRKAWTVYIWLRSRIPNSDKVFDFLNKATRSTDRTRSWTEYHPDIGP
jgi:hypothetical protein